MADLAEPLWELMAERVRASHVVATDDAIMPMLITGKTTNARMWVFVGDDDYPYNVFDFTLNRGRDGPKYFLKDYRQVLLAECWAHMRLKLRQQQSAPLLAQLRERLLTWKEQLLPKHPMAEAVNYALSQ